MKESESGFMKGLKPTMALIRQTSRRWLLPALVLLLFFLLTSSVWNWLWQEWLNNSYYGHGLLIVPVVVYLVWRRIHLDPDWQWQSDTGNPAGLAILAVSLAAYLYFLNDKAFFLAAFAMIGLLTGLVWTLGGRAVVGKLAFPIAYLLLMVPLPLLDRITLPLALFTGVCSGALVKFFGLDITILGNAITLPNANLVIGAQCSGVNSIISLTSLNVLLAYVVTGPLWGRIVLALFAIPLAMLGNILRVANLLWVARAWGADAAFRFYHDYSGIVFFVLVLILLIPVTKLLRCHQFRLDVI